MRLFSSWPLTDSKERKNKAEAVLSYLPFTLFFPLGFVYTGFFLFLLALIADGDYRAHWQNVRRNPIFVPVLLLSSAFIIIALYSDHSVDRFWRSFAHYQTYLILLVFISVGSGAWQAKAMKVFLAGAVFAATVFYLTLWNVVPAKGLFVSYVVYNGNKSILLGILLAIAAGLVFLDIRNLRGDLRCNAWRLAIFIYLCGALLFISKGRSGHLIFLLMILLGLMFKLRSMSWRGWTAAMLGLVMAGGVVWTSPGSLQQRVMQTAKDVEFFAQTVDQRAETSTGIRLQMYRHTFTMISEKPLQGFGIGAWMPVFLQRYGNTISEASTTPHNDYVLYAAEGGVIGLGALLVVWLSQLHIALRLGGRRGMQLGLLTVAIMVSGMFNAVLRDGVFAMPFMILSAILLAGLPSSAQRWRIGENTRNELLE